MTANNDEGQQQAQKIKIVFSRCTGGMMVCLQCFV